MDILTKSLITETSAHSLTQLGKSKYLLLLLEGPTLHPKALHCLDD